MSPTVKKCLFAALGALLMGLPRAVPALAPFTEIFVGVGGAISGGALVPRPGDMRAPTVSK
jgi:hypothetical protein